jgi:hypothetical protein
LKLAGTMFKVSRKARSSYTGSGDSPAAPRCFGQGNEREGCVELRRGELLTSVAF